MNLKIRAVKPLTQTPYGHLTKREHLVVRVSQFTMNKKLKFIILGLLLATTASASVIYPIQENLIFKILRCTWHVSCYRTQLGSTITTISGSTKFTNFPALYNATINSLNDTKIENASTSIAAITTLSNLASVGTLTVGSLGSGFTTVAIGRGGTGSSSPSGILWGDGVGAYTSIGQGLTGQLLTSNGATIPTFGSPGVDLTIHYVWTGQHTFGTTSPLVTFQNGTTTFTRNTAKVGIGTTSPEVSLSVATDTVIYGGLGVGSATTTPGNLKVTGFTGIGGTTTTNGLAILNNNQCVGCVQATTSVNTGALQTTQGVATQVIATCPSSTTLTGGGLGAPGFVGLPEDISASQLSYGITYNGPSSLSQNAWMVRVIALRATNSAGTLSVFAICAKN